MKNLTTPSQELSSRILEEVTFEDRLVGSTLHERRGVKRVSLYSLEEVFFFLREPYPQIDLDQLVGWISTVMKDRELADRIKMVIVQEMSEHKKLLSIRDLVARRLIQCNQIAGKLMQKKESNAKKNLR